MLLSTNRSGGHSADLWSRQGRSARSNPLLAVWSEDPDVLANIELLLRQASSAAEVGDVFSQVTGQGRAWGGGDGDDFSHAVDQGRRTWRGGDGDDYSALVGRCQGHPWGDGGGFGGDSPSLARRSSSSWLKVAPNY